MRRRHQMDEMLVGLGMIDHMNGGKGMRAIYDRIGDEPKRPVRRRAAALLRYMAAQLAPALPEPAADLRVATEQAAS